MTKSGERDEQKLLEIVRELRPSLEEVSITPEARDLLMRSAQTFAKRMIESGSDRAKHRSSTNVEVCDLRDFAEKHVDLWGFALDDLHSDASTLTRNVCSGVEPKNKRHMARLEMRFTASRSVFSDGVFNNRTKKKFEDQIHRSAVAAGEASKDKSSDQQQQSSTSGTKKVKKTVE